MSQNARAAVELVDTEIRALEAKVLQGDAAALERLKAAWIRTRDAEKPLTLMHLTLPAGSDLLQTFSPPVIFAGVAMQRLPYLHNLTDEAVPIVFEVSKDALIIRRSYG